ncbi:MAG: nuclease-related domain-containing protein [Actinomycetota bacterium]
MTVSVVIAALAVLLAVGALVALAILALRLADRDATTRPDGPPRPEIGRRRTRRPTRLERGAEGEAIVNRVLADLDPTVYVVRRNLWLPHERAPDGKTEIDHLVVSVAGIDVIETKNWRGDISGTTGARSWTVHFPDGTSEDRANPIRQNEIHRQAVADAADVTLSKVAGIVVMTGPGRVPPELHVGNVIYPAELQARIGQHAGRGLTPEEIQRVVAALDAAVVSPRRPVDP